MLESRAFTYYDASQVSAFPTFGCGPHRAATYSAGTPSMQRISHFPVLSLVSSAP